MNFFRGMSLAIPLGLLLWLLILTPFVYRQEAAPEAQAMSTRIFNEVRQNIACDADRVSLQRQLAAANAELKHLRVDANGNPKEK